MEKNNYSAEKELLKAIEGSPGRGKKGKIKNFALNRGELKSRVLFFYDKLKNNFLLPRINIFKEKFIFPDKSFNFNAVQGALKLCAYFFLFYYLVVVGKGVYMLNHIPTFNIPATKIAKSRSTNIGNLLKEFAYYSDSLIKRNIFIPSVKEETTVEPTESSKVEHLTDNLKIVGLSWSKNISKRFVIIEDIEKKSTHFLKEQDAISNLTVKTILKDRVILIYQDEEIVLR
jgi:hypothetical protein